MTAAKTSFIFSFGHSISIFTSSSLLSSPTFPAHYVEMTDLERKVELEFKKMEFREDFIDAVGRKTREILENNRKTASSQEQALINQKNALEARRNRLEDTLLDGTIDREVFKRLHNEIQEQIINVDNQILELDNKGKIDVDLIEEVLAFTRNIHQAYVETPQFLKRHYLRFFFEKFIIKKRKIYRVVPTPIFRILKNEYKIIIRPTGLLAMHDIRTFYIST